jgi:hypothetical protein
LGQVAVHPGRLEFFLVSAQVNLLLRLPFMLMTCMLPGTGGCADATSAMYSMVAPSTVATAAAVDADHRCAIIIDETTEQSAGRISDRSSSY